MNNPIRDYSLLKSIMKYIFFFILMFPLFTSSVYGSTIKSTSNNGSCDNSYFIKKNSDILSTMNLLITGDIVTRNEFQCQSYTMDQTTDQSYNLSVKTTYDKVPYIIQFIGKQSSNNNGIVFIPSDVMIINYATDNTVMHYSANDIIGACTYDPNNTHSKDKVMCLVALRNDKDTSLAIKIHLK